MGKLMKIHAQNPIMKRKDNTCLTPFRKNVMVVILGLCYI